MNIDDLHAEGYSFTLADMNEVMLKEWQNTAFDFHDGSMFEIPADVYLVPGNSFGLLREGIEQVVLEKIKKTGERTIQSLIKEEPNKELLVGQSVHIGTTNGNIIYSPINRIPRRISEPTNIYLAFRSGVALGVEMGYKSFVFPAFGTGMVYLMKEDWATRMMTLAIEDVFNEKVFPTNLDEAIALHEQGYPK